MIDFVEYIVSQLKNKSLSKDEAASLLYQYSQRSTAREHLHPLLQSNTSDIESQRYSSRFTGDEFFLKDHRVVTHDNTTQKIFPAVAYIEMAREALVRAYAINAGDDLIVELQDVVWLRPLFVDAEVQIHIEIFETECSQTEFEIFTLKSQQKIVHCRGLGRLSKTAPATMTFEEVVSHKWDRERDGDVIYKTCMDMGLLYGTSWKSISNVKTCDYHVLAELELDDSIKNKAQQYFLHPAMADGAFQCALALIDDAEDAKRKTVVPFSIEYIRLDAPCTKKMYAFSRPTKEPGIGGEKNGLDVDIFDEHGNQCVSVRGFASRVLVPENQKNASPSIAHPSDTIFVTPVWELLDPNEAALSDPAEEIVQSVYLLNIPDTISKPSNASCISHSAGALASVNVNLADEYEYFALFCLDKIKSLIEQNPRREILFQLVCSQPNGEMLSGLEGLFASAHRECPNFHGQLVIVDDWYDVEQRMETAKSNRFIADKTVVRFSNKKLYRKAWSEIEKANIGSQVVWKEHGVYLITGGMGELGYVFAQEILSKTKSARLILVGRSELDEKRSSRLTSLRDINPQTDYVETDIEHLEKTKILINRVVNEHGSIDGILHCAGVIEDDLIASTTVTSAKKVMAPKVRGTINLDEATKHITLDFMVFFSSAAAAGNVGQSVYGSANGFLNAFSSLRNRLVKHGSRSGKTLAIGWPLWESGGMSIDAGSKEYLYNHYGMRPLATKKGLEIFYQCLELKYDEILVVSGELEKLRLVFFQRSARSDREVNIPPETSIDGGNQGNASALKERALSYFSLQLSKLIKLPAHDIDPFEKLEKYGIDSILVTEFTNELEKTFGKLSKTIFFEFQTINEVAEYFAKYHQEKLKALTSLTEANLVDSVDSNTIEKIDESNRSVKEFKKRRNLSRKQHALKTDEANVPPLEEPIAIVGLSGRYPQSENLIEFWRNLREGRDAITEVPENRWRWQDYFSENRLQEGCHFSKWGGFIDGVAEFDPLFFNIAPAEAEAIDPQERLFLQHAWMALEDSGYSRRTLKTTSPGRLPGQVGVYVGVMYSEYQLFGAENSKAGKRQGVANSFSSIANRVSYFLDVHGPSIALDTMCSSSLTAIHLACQDLRNLKTTAAIAGGVNVTIHPNKYLILSQAQFISTSGHCQSFGEGGDGYIPGEGVGAVVLKRLSDAEADHNHVYGVIRGSALNHGGKTNGYTVPNLVAQVDVIKHALDEAAMDPRHVSYIEAHGTGTKLGDPIEIAALTRAFSIYNATASHCELGSVKSNIGHCEAAAGIAGLTKILLQMKYKQLVPSLHSDILNPDIDFSKTPLKVNQELKAWARPCIDGKEVKRIAGLSSFGAGGANAHLVVEEYQPRAIEDKAVTNENTQEIILLSARTQSQLEKKVSDFLEHLQCTENQAEVSSEEYLQNLAYTLQIGREHFERRIGFMVSSLSDLIEKLESIALSKQTLDNIFYSSIEKNKGTLSLFKVDDDLKSAVNRWLENKKYTSLLELWAAGLDVDWRRLHLQSPRFLVSLPVYPFSKQTYWVARSTDVTNNSISLQKKLHPLIHLNTSDLESQRFTTEFTGEEFFLHDHEIIVDGELTKVLPAVVYLEMAREAISRSVPRLESGQVIELCNVVWLRPLTVKSDIQIVTEIRVGKSSSFEFSIRSLSNNVSLVYCEGEARIRAKNVRFETSDQNINFDSASVESLYQSFETLGIKYGSRFRAIQGLGRESNTLVASLALSQLLVNELDSYHLHPSLMDSALHAVMDLFSLSPLQPKKAFVPFSLDSVVVNARCQRKMIARVQLRQKVEDVLNHITYDIDLINSEGEVCVTLQGLTSKSIPREHKSTELQNNIVSSLVLSSPVWKHKRPKNNSGTPGTRTHVLLYNMPDYDCTQVQDDITHCTHLPNVFSGNLSLDKQFIETCVFLFHYLKNILSTASKEKTILQLISKCSGSEQSIANGFSGLFRTARLESPNLSTQIICIDQMHEPGLKSLVKTEALNLHDDLIRYSDGERYTFSWEPFEPSGTLYSYADDGVFLITGGLGGIGKIFAKNILDKTQNSLVILTGRTDVNEAKTRINKDFVPNEARRIVYEQVDVSNYEAVDQCFKKIATQYRPVTGILHCAGTLSDQYLIGKHESEVRKVLAPKVSGVVNLDRASKEYDLQIFVLFSSVSGVVGNPGQSDYAAANSFMDQFARLRSERVNRGERKGQTLSINWPLWQAGGMKVSQDQITLLKDSTGIEPLTTENGLSVFRKVLGDTLDSAMVLEGNKQQILTFLAFEQEDTRLKISETKEQLKAVDHSKHQQLIERYLVQEFSSVLKIPSAELYPEAALEVFGIDSIIAMKITSQLEGAFGPLSKTLFFEYQTIQSLAMYFATHHAEAIQLMLSRSSPHLGGRIKSVVPQESISADRVVHSASTQSPQRFLKTITQNEQCEVAIVGVAGRYPQAENVDKFWQNLISGKDCITEVPRHRWDHEIYFDPQKGQKGKTYSRWGGFIDDVDKFDPMFFNISPREAELIDPQERLYLQTAWEAIEDAGYSRNSISGKQIGVYVGVMWGQYEIYGVQTLTSANKSITGSSYASIANRVSYFFNFSGPSMAVDSMCSSSLTAIHLACNDIRLGEVEAAIAGGVNLTVHPYKYLNLSQGNFVSSDGKCRSFGEGGDGYVPGEGVGAIVLKPLNTAELDGDHIYGVVKSTHLNHGGKTNGYTVPNPIAQGKLIRDSFRKANIEPSTISYVEAHGTGTALGDPIEISGLLHAFEGSQMPTQSCPIGSVKSNIGHLESAAGIAAVTKALMQLKHNAVPPSLHASPPNPNIDLHNTPFFVATDVRELSKSKDKIARIAVSSFGAGGANGHLVLEGYRPDDVLSVRPEAGSEQSLFVLSAKDKDSLREYAEKILHWIDIHSESTAFDDFIYTCMVGRTALEERLAIPTTGFDHLKSILSLWIRESEQQRLNDFIVVEGNINTTESRHKHIIDGEAGRDFMKALFEKNDFERLGKLWVTGVEVDWSDFVGAGYKRISLPTYPFKRDHYWIDAQLPNTLDAPLTKSVESELSVLEKLEERLYRTEWTLSPLKYTENYNVLAGNILLIGDFEPPFVESLGSNKQVDIFRVQNAATFSIEDSNIFLVNFASEEHISCLVDQLVSSGKLPSLVIHQGATISQQQIEGAVSCHEKALTDDMMFIFLLTRELMNRSKQKLTLLSFIVSEESQFNAHILGLVGFYKTLSLENPRYDGRVVEFVEEEFVSQSHKQRLEHLTNELSAREPTERHVKYRVSQHGSLRYQIDYSEILLSEISIESLPLKQMGVYVVTGGLGGIGLQICEELAKEVNAKLAIFSRSPLDTSRQKRIDHLVSLGADVMYLETDVSDATSLKSSIDSVKKHYSDINGIFHCAGVNDDGFILRKRKEAIKNVISAKLQGTLNLDLCTQHESMDLFMLFSSIASISGNVGQCDYAYANSFLDEYAHYRESLRKLGRRCGKSISVNWPFWESGGMSVSKEQLDTYAKATGILPLPFDRGLAMWRYCLSVDAEQVIPLYGEQRLIYRHLKNTGRSMQDSIWPSTLDANTDELSSKTEALIKELVSREIKLASNKIDVNLPFDSFGLDSISIGRLNQEFETRWGSLPKTLMYEYDSISSLSEFLVRDYTESVLKYFAQSRSLPPSVLLTGSVPVSAKHTHQPLIENIDLSEDTKYITDKIAIIGVHGLFPKSNSLDEFWNNLENGADLVEEVPQERWNASAYYEKNKESTAKGKIYCKWGGFLREYDQFDNELFKIHAEEAKVIDPQERLFLMSVASLLEDAGYTKQSLAQNFSKGNSANVGVFVGVTSNTYNLLAADEWQNGNFTSPGSLPWSIANRVSYYFDFQGPSMPVDTACSSSLVALDYACESLKRKDSQLAIAGGVNLYLHPAKYHSLCVRGMLSGDGVCASYGNGDDGFIPGEGVGSILLKPLAKAESDGDHIYGVISGYAHEHSGRSNGYSSPNPNSQARVIARTLHKAQLSAESIGYVEGHGTGTLLGDSIEIAALTKAFATQTERKQFCALGSVKANLGHSESAAGITGIIKVLMQFKHKRFAPTIHSDPLNPDIDFDCTPFYLQQTASDWMQNSNTPRAALVNSFGAGGVNACVALEEYIDTRLVEDSHGPYLFVISARYEDLLKETIFRYISYLEKQDRINLQSLCYTLQVGRKHEAKKIAIIFSTLDQLKTLLRECLNEPQEPYIFGNCLRISNTRVASGSDVERLNIDGLAEYARSWVEGDIVDWNVLYNSIVPKKTPLPTSPYRLARHWVSTANSPASAPSKNEVSTIYGDRFHPFVSHNTSTLNIVSFSSQLDIEQVLVSQHKVNNSTIFPGSGLLEIAYITGSLISGEPISRITDIVWASPVTILESTQMLHTIFNKPLNGNLYTADFEIVTDSSGSGAILHCEGQVNFDTRDVGSVQKSYLNEIDALRSSCDAKLSREDLYAQFRQYGLDYGPAYQAIKVLYRSENKALSQIELPEEIATSLEEFGLHPSIIDGAFQSVVGSIGNPQSGRLYLPFSVEEIQIHGSLPRRCYVYVEAKPSASNNEAVKVFDLAIVSMGGTPIVNFKNVYMKDIIEVNAVSFLSNSMGESTI
ncbi:SDR family NAD(P)-dependent oxidoreductase [Teredinibacter turnerae]|uniref:SDR family NAD(P)-dependent oxidoreductase n=1 Tax=Teredinibacter turnerae TaxID=2426 RepID=UPI0005F86ADD|nr:SDR family NAD(P)-dependent oxidoreductase [Teredinibacter turnerae]